MRLDSSSQVERSDLEQAAKDWATRPFGNGNQIGPERVVKRFRLIVCGWLRFAGRLHEPDRAPGPHQDEVDAYCRYMEEERGLSPATIATAQHHLQKFFGKTRKPQLMQSTIAHIEQYLAGLGELGWTRNGIRTLAYHTVFEGEAAMNIGVQRDSRRASSHCTKVSLEFESTSRA